MARRKPLLLAGLLVLAPCVMAASILDFDVWMRKIDKRSVAVQRKLAERDTEAALADARELALLYGQMETFFRDGEHGPEGADWSRADKERALAIAAAVEAADFDAAASHAIGITKACSNCHEKFRPFK